jgi:hypothetical protein
MGEPAAIDRKDVANGIALAERVLDEICNDTFASLSGSVYRTPAEQWPYAKSQETIAWLLASTIKHLADECQGRRFDPNLVAETKRLRAEISELRSIEPERDAYRAMLADVVASARSSPIRLSDDLKRAREVLRTGAYTPKAPTEAP